MRKTLTSFLILIVATLPGVTFAAASSDLQKTIDAKNQEIESLQSEIDHYEGQVAEVKGQTQTLQSALNAISQNQKKLQTNISLTNKKIDRANLTIEQNEAQIGDLGEGIISSTTALNETIRALHRNDNKSIIELLASEQTVSDFLRDVDDIVQVQKTLKNACDYNEGYAI